MDGHWMEVTVTLAALIASPLPEAIMGSVGGSTIAEAIRRLAGRGGECSSGTRKRRRLPSAPGCCRPGARRPLGAIAARTQDLAQIQPHRPYQIAGRGER